MRELLLAIGLEALYRGTLDYSIRGGDRFPSREMFLRGKVATLIFPADYMRLMQLCIEVQPLQTMPNPTDRKLKLVH